MRNKVLISLIVVILVGMAFYYLLGGFSEIEMRVVAVEDIHLIGYEYRGTPQDENLEKTFQKIEELLAAHPENRLNTIYYVEPAGKLDTMTVFVGTEYNEKMAGDLEEKIITSSQAIVASLRSHRFVMPGPDRVKRKIEEYARENGLETQGIYIDRIVGDDHVDVLAPLK
jgi:effector-binding domain-containing protein